jgi:uncharacterized protein (DUF608 family)
MDRRHFMRVVGAGAASLMVGSMPGHAGTFATADFEKLIPEDKKLNPEWIKSLFARGSRTIYRGSDLKYIGMPVGGLCAGQVYLGGDGKLWWWDIFNRYYFSGFNGEAYTRPYVPSYPIDQGVTLKVTAGGSTQTHTLDKNGFSDISFNGEYPFGFVEYKDASCPVTASLEAFSPFTPLSVDDSSLPVTVMRYTLRNTSAAPVEIELTGHIENGAALYSRYIYGGRATWKNQVVRDGNSLRVDCGMKILDAPPASTPRPAIVFADFEGADFGSWTTEGDAFGTGPLTQPPAPPDQRVSHYKGKSFANSYSRSGGDSSQGTLTSPEFTIERSFINFLIAGGNKPEELCMNLLVDGDRVRSSTGMDTEDLQPRSWDVSEYEGKKARIQIVDRATGGWGHIEVDQIQFEDVSDLQKYSDRYDLGTMSLALVGPGADDTGSADGQSETAERPMNPAKKMIGSITRKVTLQPGQTHTANFIIAWHFPKNGNDKVNPQIYNSQGRYYATVFPDAAAVAKYACDNFERLYSQTKTWHDTWYDSTLPYWFLDRTLLNVSTLATSTAFRFANGQFWGWEGVGSCAGTCTHVWSYEQAMGRLFPDFDRLLRDKLEFRLGVSLQPDGQISNRDGSGIAATDGQAGTILRGYRDHLTSPDDAFLKRNWDGIKLAIGWLIAQDGNKDGIIEGKQPNTMDEDWYGAVPWMSGLYLAALRAGEEMALDMTDADFAHKCRAIFEAGQKNFMQRLWNEEAGYYFQIADPQHADALGAYNGCDSDQVYGQSWGHQVGLGRIFPEKQTKQALASIWKYNFAPDVGPYRKVHVDGRPYATDGQAGLIICTWPQLPATRKEFRYCNECWAGIEHQVAGHMLWEGMITEGLAIERAIHDRYHPSHCNPWNETECGDHYARSMASYGVFIGACGFEYNGPKGTLAFAPRLTPENFRSAFTAAEGWGSFAQTHDGGSQRATLEVKWGKLELKTLTLTPVKTQAEAEAIAMLDGKKVSVVARRKDGRIAVDFTDRLTLLPGQKLEIIFG